jgi:ribonuclease P protein component
MEVLMTPPWPSEAGLPAPETLVAVLSCVPGSGKNESGPGRAAGASAAACPEVETIRQRADFLRAAQGRKAGTGGFLLQARARTKGSAEQAPGTEPCGQGPARFGFTASKKIGNAVFRNRAKRRLRALAREILAPVARPGWDYVLVAKPGATVVRDWALLQDDLREAIARVHK